MYNLEVQNPWASYHESVRGETPSAYSPLSRGNAQCVGMWGEMPGAWGIPKDSFLAYPPTVRQPSLAGGFEDLGRAESLNLHGFGI